LLVIRKDGCCGTHLFAFPGFNRGFYSRTFHDMDGFVERNNISLTLLLAFLVSSSNDVLPFIYLSDVRVSNVPSMIVQIE
jgi:hypothetical protein